MRIEPKREKEKLATLVRELSWTKHLPPSVQDDVIEEKLSPVVRELPQDVGRRWCQ